MSRPTSQRYKEGKIVPHPAVQRLIIKYFKTKLKSIKARDFAIIAHGNQKYGDQPYVVHLDEVFNVLLRYGKTSDNLVNICYLHDVLEDTDVTYEQIEKDFGDYISTCVHAITDPSGKNRKEKKAKLYEKLKRLDYSYNDALIIKAADRLANIRMAKKNNNGFLSMYKKEHNDLKEAIYRAGLCDNIWEEIENHLI